MLRGLAATRKDTFLLTASVSVISPLSEEVGQVKIRQTKPSSSLYVNTTTQRKKFSCIARDWLDQCAHEGGWHMTQVLRPSFWYQKLVSKLRTPDTRNWYHKHKRRTYGGDTQSRNLRKKLAQVSCGSFLHQIFVQVHASSADDTSNKNGRSWTKQITFSILSVDHSIGTQNFYLNNLNKFKK